MEYPSKYNHHPLLKKLDTDKYQYYQNSQDYLDLAEMVGLPEEYRNDITGAIALIGDGDIEAVWFSESCNPYSVYSTYYALPFYRPESWNTDKLPCYWLETNEEYWI